MLHLTILIYVIIGMTFSLLMDANKLWKEPIIFSHKFFLAIVWPFTLFRIILGVYKETRKEKSN